VLALVVADGALAGAVVALPWYSLDPYVGTGWQATAWARVALVLALTGGALAVLGDRVLPAACSLAALGLVLAWVAVPPELGFGFGDLPVPVERRWGCWAALAAALAAAALAAARAWSARARRQVG
jgi:hypothetical protein